MNNKAKVTGQCPECKRQFEARTPIILKQMIGFHLRHAHGRPGVFSTPEGKRRAARHRHWRLNGLTDAQIAEKEKLFQQKHQEQPAAKPVPQYVLDRRERQRRWNEKRKQKPDEPAEVKLFFICPSCHCRIYVGKDEVKP